MHMLKGLFAATLCAVPALALGQSGDRGQETQPSAEKVEASKKICRKLDGMTGSRLVGSGRVCKTEEQWAKIDKGGKTSASMFAEQAKREEGN